MTDIISIYLLGGGAYGRACLRIMTGITGRNEPNRSLSLSISLICIMSGQI